MSIYPRFKIEDHPFYDYYIPSGCKFLIVGTFPTRKEKRLFPFFYASQSNLMWRILLDVFGGKFRYNLDEEAIIERKSFMKTNAIGMTDMLLKCYRRDNSSKDEALYPIVWNNILLLLDRNLDIHTLILTSRTPVWGALGLLKTFFLQREMDFVDPKPNVKNILIGSFKYNKRVIRITVPISPSMRAHEEQKITYLDLVDMYKECLK